MGCKKKGTERTSRHQRIPATENKVTELFEGTSDITEIIIILFLCLFVPEEKQTIRQARERSWYLRKRKQS